MATIASKHKLNTKSIKDKYNALKEVEDGKTKLQVAAKYAIPKNTLSNWLKKKDIIFEATKKGSNSKRQRLRQGTFANLDQAMFKWLLVVRSRDVAVSALYCHKISREGNFAIFANGSLIREIKFPRKKCFSLQFREIFKSHSGLFGTMKSYCFCILQWLTNTSMSFPKIKNIEHEIYKNLFFFFNVFNNQSRTTTCFLLLGSFVDFIIVTFLKKYLISPYFTDLLPLFFFHLFSFSFLDCFFLARFLRHQYCRKQTNPSLNYLLVPCTNDQPFLDIFQATF